MRQVFLIFLLFVSSIAFGKHPAHFSIVNMELNKDSLHIDYSIRLFDEDFNYLIYGIYHDEQEASKSDSTINMNNLVVKNYIQKKFLISLDGILTNPEFKGIKNEGADTWLYFSLELDQIPDLINIQNKIFVDLFSDQINLLILVCGSKEDGFTFDYQNTEQLISLKNIYQ
jgi:hypothetical protein